MSNYFDLGRGRPIGCLPPLQGAFVFYVMGFLAVFTLGIVWIVSYRQTDTHVQRCIKQE